MAANIQDVVRANLVLVGCRLLGQPEEFDEFRQAIKADVQMAQAGLIANIASGMAEPGQTLALQRDRITIELSPSRSIISREYPSRDDLRRLAEVSAQAISHTSLEGSQPRAFGFNIDIVFEQDSEETAFAYLSRQLFGAESLGNEDWQLVGAAGRLIFDDNGRHWTINLEPRFHEEHEKRVFLSGNLHLSDRPLPNEDEIVSYLEEAWDETHQFVRHLDGRRGCNG